MFMKGIWILLLGEKDGKIKFTETNIWKYTILNHSKWFKNYI